MQDLRKKAIKKAKELREFVYCKCGRKMVYDYEGEIICPVVEKETRKSFNNKKWDELSKEHNTHGGVQDDLAVYEFILDFFKIKEKELK